MAGHRLLRPRALELLFFAATLFLSVDALAQPAHLPLTVASPDKHLEVKVALNAEGAPVYQINYRGQSLIAPSRLGLDLRQGGMLSKGLTVTDVASRSGDSHYTFVAGKTKEARDRYNEAVISLEESQPPRRKLELIFRAYDDGAAFRYRLPAQAGMDTIEVKAEQTEFRFPTDLTCWALQLGSYTTSYEGEYDRITSGRIHQNSIVGLPLVCKTRDEAATFAISEADLDDYAGMYFAGLGSGYGVVSRLSPRRDDKTLAVRAAMKPDGFKTPWRVVMAAGEPAWLIQSTLIMNLNPPCAIGDTSWIRPGKAAWDWWSGPLAEGIAKPGMNNETMKYYIDFAAEFGLEYMLVDAGWYTDKAWGEGANLKADITKTVPAIDLPELVRYARERKVDLFVWLNWVPTRDQMDRAFPYYEKLGIKGVKVDFMDSDDQEMVEFFHRVLKTAAAHHLLVDLHGAYKPTGLARTYPNYITQEGVMGAEYNKWSARVTATHNLTLPFTRMLLGPMDYTPGGFRNAARRQFKIQNTGPEVMTTRAQQLAMYVVYESPFACVSDSPGSYRGQAGADFLKIVPTSWDETRALAGDIGEYVVVARRHNDEWYVAAMCNEQPRDITVPLDFLGRGPYRFTMYSDGATPADVVIKNGDTSALNGIMSVELKLAAGGGSVIRITPMK